MLQNTVLVAFAAGAGLLLAGAVGLGAPLLTRALAGEDVSPALLRITPAAAGLGAGAALLIIGLDIAYFRSALPPGVHLKIAETATWKRFLACFHGGITEEILLRLFTFSLLAWLLGFIWRAPAGNLPEGVYWAANVGAALLFGAGHLPATAALTPLGPKVIARALILNGLAGLVFGYLYWRYGLLAAMIGHFTADIMLLVLASPLLRSWDLRLAASFPEHAERPNLPPFNSD